MRMVLRLAALFLSLAFAGVAQAQSDDLQEISRLMRQGQHAQALERVNQYLASRPRDAQGRFLKGLIFVEQSKVAEAIDMFSKLSQDYPELPEPYNNLAVLYASQGQYEKARQSLEMSIRTHPSYATAYENLGDVYTKLASQAYDKALQLDSTNTAAQSKLSLVRELISATNRPGRAAPTKGADAQKATVVASAPKATVPEQKPIAEAKPAQPPEPAKAAPEPKAVPAKVPEKQQATQPSQDDVLKAVNAWAQAWAKKDVSGYLAFYAKSFKVPNGEARDEWEKGRRQRISAPKKIEVGLDAVKVSGLTADKATVSFRQHYRSDSLKVDSGKTLVMVRVDGKWLIEQERVGN